MHKGRLPNLSTSGNIINADIKFATPIKNVKNLAYQRLGAKFSNIVVEYANIPFMPDHYYKK